MDLTLADAGNREIIETDVLIVGAGPAGLSAAIRLKQVAPHLSVTVVEKSAELGGHIISGAVMNPVGLDALLPNWRDLGAPVVMTPALEGWGEEAPSGRMYAGGLDGVFVCVEARTGKLIWQRDLMALANAPVEVISSPALEVRSEPDGADWYRLYVGVTLLSSGRVGELYCFEDRTQAGE